MKAKHAPILKQVGTLRALELALQIERIRKADPVHYADIMRKFEELSDSPNK